MEVSGSNDGHIRTLNISGKRKRRGDLRKKKNSSPERKKGRKENESGLPLTSVFQREVEVGAKSDEHISAHIISGKNGEN